MKISNKVRYEIQTGRALLQTVHISPKGVKTEKLTRGVSQEIYRNHLGYIKIPVVEIINGIKRIRTIIKEYKPRLR